MNAKLFIFFSFTLLMHSCATILNGVNQRVKIIPESHISQIKVMRSKDTFASSENRFKIERAKAPIQVHYFNSLDSSFHTVEKKPFISNSVWWNIYASYGIGIVVDLLSDKKFALPRRMYLTDDNKLVIEKKGNMRLFTSFEYAFTGGEKTSDRLSVPFTNIPIGLEYFYDHDKCFSGEAIFFPFDSKNIKFDFPNNLGLILSARNTHLMNNFELSYGASTIMMRDIHSLGGSFGATNMFSRTVGLQLLYEPQYLNLKKMDLEYNHAIRTRLLFKFNINN